MTQKELYTAVRALGLTICSLDGEYRIAYKGIAKNTEPSAYYTKDKDDALATARLF